MGGVKKCAVCKRSEKIPGVRLFSFPRQKYRCDQWLQNIGNPELFKFSTYRLSVAYKVCEQHFERNCFFSDMLNRLARDAVPTLFGLNVKRHVAIDGAVLKHQQNKCPTEKFQKLSALCHEGVDCDKVSGRMPGNTTPVLGLENFTDSKLPQEHMTCTDNTLNKNDEFNFCVNEIPQHDFHQLSVLSVCPSRLEDANNKQINTQEKVSLQIDKMCESESKELVPSTEAHLANTCRTEDSSSPISDGDGVSVEHFLHSWIVECDLNENENSSTLFGGIGERVSDKKECEHDIGEATMSFSEVSETVGGAEGDLEQEQFSDYMDVGSMNGLDQSDFLHSWMPGSSIVSNKGHVSNERIDEQQCALSDLAIGLMAEGTEHEKISAVKDITVCNWANEKVFSGLPKLSHDDYDELSVCEQDSSEPTHFGSISLLGLCGEEHPVVSPGNRVGSSDELPLCDSLPTETSCENVFTCQKFVRKKLSGSTNSSKENFPKAISSADINFLPVEFSFNKDFPTIQLVQPDSVKLSDELCQVTYTSDGIAVTEANLNPTLHSCNVSKLSQGSDLSQNISCTDQVNSKENVNSFVPPKSVTLNVSDSKEASDSTNYVVCSFESICRLCLAVDQVMYPIFSDSNSMTDKDVVSCIPVKLLPP
ncbi:uncharacterized protein LOC134543087 isoform X2 [Bacillus rossius redtenbacheri]|uniref:uncharacterized protein LOC134543087 isoform X2 n=1 Tax=Bacillus rossius redtenbacheri TaxID=93214 RepID=UPI002FDDCC0B